MNAPIFTREANTYAGYALESTLTSGATSIYVQADARRQRVRIVRCDGPDAYSMQAVSAAQARAMAVELIACAQALEGAQHQQDGGAV